MAHGYGVGWQVTTDEAGIPAGKVAVDAGPQEHGVISCYEKVPRDHGELREYLATLESRFAPGHLAEGIVFHHPDGRRAKIKRKDFPRVA